MSYLCQKRPALVATGFLQSQDELDALMVFDGSSHSPGMSAS